MSRALDDEYPIRPFPDPADFDRARAWLTEAGFTSDLFPQELGIRDGTPPGGVEGRALRHRLAGAGPRQGLTALFVLGQPLSRAEAADALGPVPPERWRETGLLVEHEDGFRCPVRLVPLPDGHPGWCVGDSSDSHDRPDYVMCPATASINLARIMIRRPVRSLLDIGTGSGCLALAAAGFAEEVTATDLCPRAVPLARFGALLSGIENVEVLAGSMFEPVAGRRFDRIVANAPFFLGPASGHMYRESGGTLAGIAWRMARAAPAHLEEGGICQMLIHWPLARGEETAPRMREWLAGLGADAWVMIQARLPVPDYVRGYAADLHYPRSPEYAEEYRRGIEFFAARGIGEVGMGVLILRRRAGDDHWVHVEESPGVTRDFGEGIAGGFQARDRLRADPDGSRLLAACPVVEPDLELHTSATIGDGGAWEPQQVELRRTRGLRYVLNTEPMISALLARCDGQATVRELAAGLAEATGRPAEAVIPAVEGAFRTLIELGFVRLRGF